jgi:hypothetical protein
METRKKRKTGSQNLKEKRDSLLRRFNTDIPMQGASTSSIPTVGDGLGHLVCREGGLSLAEKYKGWIKSSGNTSIVLKLLYYLR